MQISYHIIPTAWCRVGFGNNRRFRPKGGDRLSPSLTLFSSDILSVYPPRLYYAPLARRAQIFRALFFCREADLFSGPVRRFYKFANGLKN